MGRWACRGILKLRGLNMTRKEQIEKAAEKYATHWVDTKETDFHGNYNQEWGFVLPEYNAFVAGVKWADANPNFPWISVDDDLPCNHEELIHFVFTNNVLVIDDQQNTFIAFMKKYKDNEWIWDSANNFVFLPFITHWMPIPKLPNK